MRCQYCGTKIFDIGDGEFEDELGFVACPAQPDENHRPLLTIVE